MRIPRARKPGRFEEWMGEKNNVGTRYSVSGFLIPNKCSHSFFLKKEYIVVVAVLFISVPFIYLLSPGP